MRVRTGIRAGFPSQNAWDSSGAAATSGKALAAAPPPPVYVVADLQALARRWLADLHDWRMAIAEHAVVLWDTFRSSVRRRVWPDVQVIDPNRFWEIDANRGLAIVSMLWLHVTMSWLTVLSAPLAGLALGIWRPLKSLWLAGLFSIPLLGGAMSLSPQLGYVENRSNGGAGQMVAPIVLSVALSAALMAACWWLAGVGTGGEAFAFIMGIAMTISYARAQKRRLAHESVFPKYLSRGLQLLGAGMAITLVSYLLTPQAPILFGILHLLGLATILAYPFLWLPAWVSLAVGLPIIGLGAGLWTTGLATNGLWGLVLGIRPAGLAMSDFWPLLPGLGIVLLGIAAGKMLYPEGRRNFRLPDLSETRLVRALSFLGKNSLAIYLVQEPVALAGMALVPG